MQKKKDLRRRAPRDRTTLLVSFPGVLGGSWLVVALARSPCLILSPFVMVSGGPGPQFFVWLFFRREK